MSQTTRAPQSGLRTVKRDFSEPALNHSSDIPWDPTPPKPQTGVDKRLKAIQDALADVGSKKTSQNLLPTPPLTNPQKRPSSSQDAPSQAKRRQLPTSWETDPLTTRTNYGSTTTSIARASSSSSWSAKGTSSIVAATKVVAAKATGKPAPVFLSKEQTHILNLVKEGQSVFYTGSAGTGKSVLLREIIKTLRKKFIKAPDAVAITASTGIAACNIGGVTIHSFAGIGIGEGKPDDLASKVRKNKKAMARWLRTKVLIIDEVSMVDGDLFDKLSHIAKVVRKIPKAFGGIQLVVTGDFFQLPPVTRGNAPVKFAFEAEAWTEAVQRTFNLTKVFRQTDQEFVDMLNEMRFGTLSQKSINKFKSLSREIVYEDGLGPTELFPRREDVERSNSTRMNRLATEHHTYFAMDGGIIDGPQRDKMLANFMAPSQITLRVDAQVMLIKNIDETLVNGSMGKVVRFADPALYGSEQDLAGGDQVDPKDRKKGKAQAEGKLFPVVEFVIPGQRRMREVLVTTESWKVELPNGEVQVSRTQIPLIPAWAMSIHKSQGQTLERVKVDLGRVFEKGQAYVALSRATSLDGLQVLNFDPKKVTVHPKVVQWSRTLEVIQDK